MSTLLSALAQADVLERCHGRGRTYLRVTPRFLAHAEASSARLRQQGRHTGATGALAHALLAWDAYAHDPHQGARVLVDLLDDRGQLGLLRPVFPLEEWAGAAA
jgi:hypothetical protein